MAAVLDCASTSFMARVRAKWQFGNRRHSVVDTSLGAPDGASFMGYPGFSYFRFWPDFVDSVRDAQTFFEVRLGVGGRSRIQQQHRSLTTRLENALGGWANQKAVGPG